MVYLILLHWRNGLLILDQNMIASQSEKLVFVSLMMKVSEIEVDTITLLCTAIIVNVT